MRDIFRAGLGWEVNKIIFWLLIAALNLLAIYPYITFDFLAPDLAETFYHIKMLSAGSLPYRDLFNHHFFGYLLPFLVVDKLAPLTPSDIWILSYAYNLINAILAYMVAKRLYDGSAPFLAALLTVTVGWFPNWYGMIFNLQANLLPFLWLYILAITVLARASRFSGTALKFSAFALGLVFTLDQRLLSFSLLLLPFMLIYRWKLQEIPWVFLSLALCPLAAVFYLSSNGVIGDFVSQTIHFPLMTRNKGMLLSGALESLSLLKTALTTEGVVAIGAAAGLVIAIVKEESRIARMFLPTLWICSLIYLLAGGRHFFNYLIILTPAIILSIASIPFYLQKLSRSRARVAMAIISAYCLSVATSDAAAIVEGHKITPTIDEEALRKAGIEISSMTSSKDQILVWCYVPQLYYYSGRSTSFRDMGLLSVVGSRTDSANSGSPNYLPGMIKEFREYLAKSPPQVVVDCYRPNCSRREQNRDCPGMVRNFNFVPHLKFFADFLNRKYKEPLVRKGENLIIEIYELRAKSFNY